MNKGSKKKLVVLLGTCIFTALLFGLFTRYYNDRPKDVLFSFDVQPTSKNTVLRNRMECWEL